MMKGNISGKNLYDNNIQRFKTRLQERARYFADQLNNILEVGVEENNFTFGRVANQRELEKLLKSIAKTVLSQSAKTMNDKGEIQYANQQFMTQITSIIEGFKEERDLFIASQVGEPTLINIANAATATPSLFHKQEYTDLVLKRREQAKQVHDLGAVFFDIAQVTEDYQLCGQAVSWRNIMKDF